jgi:hypothetical protein
VYKRDSLIVSSLNELAFPDKKIKKLRKQFSNFLDEIVDNPKNACETYGLPLSQLNAI